MKLGALLFLLFTFATGAGAQEPETGTWPRHTIDAADPSLGKRGADGVKLADANGDGLPDVITGWEQGGAVRICLNPGPAQARQPWPAVTVAKVPGVEDAVFADLDGDGALDAVSCAEGTINQIAIHWAPMAKEAYLDANAWTTAPLPSASGRRWMFAFPMEVNGDGRLDIVAGAKDKGAIVGWLEAPENPRQTENWKLHPMTEAGWIMSLEPMDLDGDGDLDIVLTDRYEAQRGVYWLENPGREDAAKLRGSWTRHLIGGEGRHVMFLTTGDLNGDDLSDVVSATLEGELLIFLRQAGDSVAWEASRLPLPFGLTAGKGVAIADVNLDGRPDLITTSEAQREKPEMVSVAWLEQLPGGHWKEHRISDERGRKFDRLEMLDLDGDGDLDLATCEEVHNLGVFWYENPLRSRE